MWGFLFGGNLHDYLTELVAQMSSRDAAEAIGYARGSDDAFRRLCRLYDVEIPKRRNQYTAVGEPSSTPHKVLKEAVRTTVGIEKCVVIGDIHVPFHDTRALSVALSIIEDIQPEVIVLNGDIIDMYSCSSYSKEPHRALMLQDEIDQTREVLIYVREAAPDARIVYVEGNHERRLAKYLQDRAPELSMLDVLDIRSLLGLEDLGIEYVESKGKSAYWRYGAITIGHFDKVTRKSGYTETALMEMRHESIVQGHTHRVADVTKRLPDGHVIGGMGSGCLCDLDPTYTTDPDWMQGLIVITKRTDTDRFHAEIVKIIDHEALYHDTLYSG